ncbi:MAG: MBL fold metallo-hydrolase [Candidatus Bathyarchaeota archaeon]
MGHMYKPGKILNNAYLVDGKLAGISQILSLYVVKEDKVALIDAGVSQFVGDVINSLKNLGLFPVDYIIVTHEHWDHMQGAAPLIDAMRGRVKVYASRIAKPLLEDPSRIEYDFGMGAVEPVKNVIPLDEGDVINLGGVELEVISTPGHTPGHIALYDKANRNIFVGDSIGNKVDETTFIPSHNPPWFNKEQFYLTLEKLSKISFNSICLGHYGCWDGDDAKNILSEAKKVFENFWNFFETNRNKLDDLNYLTKTLVQKYLSKSKTLERVGEIFATIVVRWLRDGFKYYYKIT